MKIRQGFVSNSSSASYVVTLHAKFDSEDNLLLDIYERCWCAINENEEEYFAHMAVVEAQAAAYRSTMDTTIEESPLSKMFESIEDARVPRARVATNETQSNYAETNTEKLMILRYTFEQEGIIINNKGNGIFSLYCETSMHNSFNDMNSLVKNIYLEYLTRGGGANLDFQEDN